MKRSFKLLVSTVTAVAILATSAMMSLAAGETGTLTVSNATVGKGYAAYKIFDATVSSDGTGVNYKKIENSALNTTLFDSDEVFTSNAAGDVIVDPEATNAEIFAKIKEALDANEDYDAAASIDKATSSTVVFEGLEFGYYYVTSQLGSAATITSLTKDVEIIDKNDMPSWNTPYVDPDTPTEPTPSGLPTPPADSTTDGKYVSDSGKNGTYVKVSTAQIDDEPEYFMISAHCPALAGANTVVSYIFTDTLQPGFTYDKSTANPVLKVNGVVVTDGFVVSDPVENADGSTTVVFTYNVPDNYAGADICITYKATVDADAVFDNVNEVDMDWKYIPYGKNPTDYNTPNNPDTTKLPVPSTLDPNYPGSPNNTTTPTKPADPESPDYNPAFPPTPNTSKTDTYVYQFEVIKVDAKNTSKGLTGAEFKLYSDADCKTEVPVVAVQDKDYQYRVAEAGETINPETDVITAGDVKIFGLDLGTYYLVETKAPDGYNLLKEAKDFTIEATLGSEALDVTVANSQGSELPSTGGMGTTIFIVAGSILMAGGFIGFITKKRMSLKDEEQ